MLLAPDLIAPQVLPAAFLAKSHALEPALLAAFQRPCALLEIQPPASCTKPPPPRAPSPTRPDTPPAARFTTLPTPLATLLPTLVTVLAKSLMPDLAALNVLLAMSPMPLAALLTVLETALTALDTLLEMKCPMLPRPHLCGL